MFATFKSNVIFLNTREENLPLFFFLNLAKKEGNERLGLA